MLVPSVIFYSRHISCCPARVWKNKKDKNLFFGKEPAEYLIFILFARLPDVHNFAKEKGQRVESDKKIK
jgi:hypothetical protein